MKILRRKILPLAVGVLILVLAAGCSGGATTITATTTATTTATSTATTTVTTTSTPTITPTITVTVTPTTPPPANPGTAAPEMTQYASDWPAANRDYENTRATTDASINSSNVNTLGVAWSMPLKNGSIFGSAATNPLIQGDTVYFQDLALNTFAIDLNTGQLKWQRIFNTPDIGPCGPAVAYGKVFIPLDPYSIAALDANTGATLWTTNISPLPSIGIDIQPTAYDGKVYVSTVPGVSALNFYAGGAYGTFLALDEATGDIIWRWDTVDDPVNLWGNPQVNSGGGSWFPPAIDTATGTTFWGVANPAPFPGTAQYPNGSSHPGPNLYTDSIVSIDQATGHLNWFNQVWPHDISDYDLQQSPVLATAVVDGTQQDIVIAAGKMGQVYAFNRASGALLWQCPVGEHQNDYVVNHDVPAGQDMIKVLPGIFGGVETPMAYSDGLLYAATNNVPTNFSGTSLTIGQEASGDLAAIDVDLGRVLWNVHLPTALYGGATVVNDLVFTATQDGKIYAFNKMTGAQVWTYQAPAGVIAWPAVAGDMIVWPAGSGGAPSLIAFKVGATAPVLEIARPIDETIEAGDITAITAAFNFSLVEKLGQANVAGEGHLHYFLDYDAPTTAGQPAVGPAGVTWAATANTTYTFSSVPAGDHFISVELVNNNHTPLNPPVVQKFSFTTLADVPTVQITSPTPGSTDRVGDFTVTVTMTNFTLTTGSGLPNDPNQGKILFYLDDALPDVPGELATTDKSVTGTSTSYTWTIGSGTHIFGVQLVNNDLTSLAIPASAEVVVHAGVSAATGP